jgi:hypothetical protein
MTRAKYLTDEQRAVFAKAYRLAITEVVRYVKTQHPLVWEHAIKEAFLSLGTEPPNIAVRRENEQRAKRNANELPIAYLRQKEINRLANLPLRTRSPWT